MNPTDHQPDWPTLLAAESHGNGALYRRLAYGVLRDSSAAEDACQQAFLKALQQQDRIRDGASLRGWLCRVIVNQSFEMLRRRRSERSAMDRLTHHVPQPDGPDGRLERCEMAQHALGQLDEPTRMIVTLRIIQGMSGNEVRRLLGCSAAEVSRRLHRGLEQMRTCLAET